MFIINGGRSCGTTEYNKLSKSAFLFNLSFVRGKVLLFVTYVILIEAWLEWEEIFLVNVQKRDLDICLHGLPLAPFLWIFQRRKSTGERLTDNHRGAKIYFNNKLTHYGKSNTVGYYRGEITVYHPLCSHAQQEKVGERKQQKGERLSDGLFGRRGRSARRQALELSGPVNGHFLAGVWGSWGYPQRRSEVKWVTMFEVRPAVIAPNIQQMSGSSAC